MEQVVVGHCCESGDLLTPAPGDAEKLATRKLPKGEVGDLCVIEGVGAYCSSMSAKITILSRGGRSPAERDGALAFIRQRQTFDQLIENELPRESFGLG